MESNRITTNTTDTTNNNSSSRDRTSTSNSSRSDYRNVILPSRHVQIPQGRARVGPLHQFHTWVRQNDNGERQRRHYTAFYLERNSISNSRSNPDVITSAEQITPVSALIPPVTTITVTDDPNLQNDVTNASTQTISNSFNVSEATRNATPNLIPFNEYFHTIASFLSTIPSSSTSNSSPRITFPENLSPSQILRSAIIAFPEANFGLNKSEINRHTVSYQYKPKKRKRMKTIASSSSSTPSSVAIDLKEQCHICLDMFNTSVLVRRLPCLHVFHIKCIDKWLKRSKKCPVCRISITINYDTLMSSLESGSTIDQCISQQESASMSNSSFLSFFAEDVPLSEPRNQIFSVND